MTVERDPLWRELFFDRVTGFRPATIKFNFTTGYCWKDKFLKKLFWKDHIWNLRTENFEENFSFLPPLGAKTGNFWTLDTPSIHSQLWLH